MSREIKFRVWDKVAKAMHVCETDSHDTFFFDPDTCDFTYYNLQNGETSNGHSDYILEQYTGLKDKNGKEIYEGDIVRQFDDEEYFVVKFEYGGFLPFTANMLTFDIDYCEVIGNIHENPELLGGKE